MTQLASPDSSSGPNTLDVSIILPVFNEVEHHREEVDRVRAAMDASDYSYEIIIVDDGSSDGSSELALSLPDVRVIRFLQNRGSGSARKAGTAAARGRVTVWTDVDMTYPNDTIPQLVKELDGYDQVVGARTTEEGTLKGLRVPAKWFIRRLASFLTKTKIPDLNSGFRAFRTDVARQYLRHLPTGFVLLAYGSGKLIYDLTTYDLRVTTNTLLAFFAAFQVFAIGLLADLVVRVSRDRDEVPVATETSTTGTP
jgi:glycosyltransferase involved in cell wall biosynthesis